MGPTGTGRSTFINLASGSSLETKVGLRSCTSKVESTRPFLVNGRQVVLLDTPGFDGTSKGDLDILEEIAEYMAKAYKNKQLLNGILYFHSIADRKIGGIATRNMRLFCDLCGDHSLKSVVIVTNMWSLVDLDVGASRETELKTEDAFFKPALDHGARFARHSDTKESAHEIIHSLIDGRPVKVKLAIQVEMVDDRLRFAQTSVAAELIRDFDTAIQNLKRKIEREERSIAQATPEERIYIEVEIRKMKSKVKEFEKRQQRFRRNPTSVPLQKRFLLLLKTRSD
ncbi:hypothetical protein CPB86DRAFT_847032 [Serendipita vermifera]|nr:hypothetical protein CPB86DRAFT_847032 [Serendipita vermifera]